MAPVRLFFNVHRTAQTCECSVLEFKQSHANLMVDTLMVDFLSSHVFDVFFSLFVAVFLYLVAQCGGAMAGAAFTDG